MKETRCEAMTNVAEAKKDYTMTQVISRLKKKVLGNRLDIPTIRENFFSEEKDETFLDSIEGENELFDGVNHKCMVFYVPGATNGVCITYDADNIVIDVSEFDMSDNG